MTRVVTVSDPHGFLPEVPECDLLLVPGDLTPIDDHSEDGQYDWLDNAFRAWLEWVPAQDIVVVGGNHDFMFEKAIYPDDLPCRYVQDETIEVQGLRLHGTPWVPNLRMWAFHATEDAMRERWAAVPDDIDILASHGPPHGYGDNCGSRYLGWERVGSEALFELVDRVRPGLHVFGHVHEDRGGVDTHAFRRTGDGRQRLARRPRLRTQVPPDALRD